MPTCSGAELRGTMCAVRLVRLCVVVALLLLAGAGVGVADGLRSGGPASSGGGGIGVGGLVVGGVAVAGIGGYLLMRRRRRAKEAPVEAPAPESGEFADVNTDDLAYRGSQALLDVDDA